jgi:divalent metal cation (Fe/Co/Zn/Cd) transporter
MKTAPPVEFPAEQDRAHRYGRRLAWVTIVYYCIDATIMYLVMGRSQAMKANWLQDAFAIIPPVGYLIANHVVHNRPNPRFPYGYHRAVSVAFFFSAISLAGLGIYLLIDSLVPFIGRVHPTIGSVRVGGHVLWLGWPMVVASIFSSALPPFFLGRMMIRPAKVTHDKVLYSTAQMNKAGWLAGASAVVGVIGIGFGYWWADYVAALVITLLILQDGWRNTKAAVLGIMDEVPRTTDFAALDPLPAKVAAYLRKLDWVKDAEVRFREEGHVLFGNAVVVPADRRGLTAKIRHAVEGVKALDWRIYDFAIMPADSPHGGEEPDLGAAEAEED